MSSAYNIPHEVITMKRKTLLICSILVALALIPAIQPVQAPTIEQWNWVTPVYEGTDDYHGLDVIAYKVGTTATLIVKVFNDRAKAPFKVRVHMSWATENKTSDEKEIQSGQWYTFQIGIPIPNVTIASNLVLHSYRIYVEYVEGITVRWLPVVSGSNFAVYSAEQADAQLLKQEYTVWRNSYSTSAGGITALLGMTSEAKELWTKAAVESYLGGESYKGGSFSDAKTHYGNALNYTKDAITSDIEKTASLEDALIGLVDAGKSLLSMQGYAYLIASIGFLLIGVGALIYLIRRSRPPVTP